MKKQLLSWILAMALCITALSPAAFAMETQEAGAENTGEIQNTVESGFQNFQKINYFTYGQYKDVDRAQWYAESVATAFEYDLMKGTSADLFAPKRNIDIGSSVALAARIHSIYYSGKADFVQGTPWYQSYADYALQNDIIARGFEDYTKTATRAEFAGIVAHSLPMGALVGVNTISIEQIPDVTKWTPYAEEIRLLYAAGVLTGSDEYGTFKPDAAIDRASIATIVTRLAKPELRCAFQPKPKPVAVTGLTVNYANYALNTGTTLNLWATITPDNATNKTLKWVSSNPKVASVSPSNNVCGVITAKAPGTAKITVTSSNGRSASCNITVKKAPPVGQPIPSTLIYGNGGMGFYTDIANGINMYWQAKNQSGKTINYYTCYFAMYNPVGDPARDEITGSNKSSIKMVGPVAPGENLIIFNLIGYTPVCSKVVLEKIKLEYADGTKETVGYWCSGFETLWNEYYNNWLDREY